MLWAVAHIGFRVTDALTYKSYQACHTTAGFIWHQKLTMTTWTPLREILGEGTRGARGGRAWRATRTRSGRAACRRSHIHLQLHRWVHKCARECVH